MLGDAGPAWWLITLGILAARLWLASWVPLGDDEGYYWVWSRHLALGYYDHPPLVAWLAAIAANLLGHSLLALRLPFVVCGTLAALTLRKLVEETTGDPRLAVTSSLLFQIIPVFFAFGLMVIPDSPLVLMWLLAARATWRLERRPGLASALLLGLAVGGALLSKLIALLLAMSVGAFLLIGPAKRPLRPLVVALASALLIMTPVLMWNAGHDWASFRYQFASRHHGSHFDARRLLLYIGSQALYLSPVVCVLVGAAVLRAIPRRDHDGDRLLWWIGTPTACTFLAAAAFTDFKPNWAAPGYATLVALATSRLSSWREKAPRFVRGIAAAAAVAAIACTVAPLVQLVRPVLRLSAGADPTVDMAGWPAVASCTERAAERIRRETGRSPFFAAGRYQLAARLEFYLRGHPDVISLNPGRDAYDDWQDLEALRGRDFVFVASDRFPTPPEALVACDSSRVDSRLVVATRGHEQFRVTIFDVRGYRPDQRRAPR